MLLDAAGDLPRDRGRFSLSLGRSSFLFSLEQSRRTLKRSRLMYQAEIKVLGLASPARGAPPEAKKISLIKPHN